MPNPPCFPERGDYTTTLFLPKVPATGDGPTLPRYVISYCAPLNVWVRLISRTPGRWRIVQVSTDWAIMKTEVDLLATSHCGLRITGPDAPWGAPDWRSYTVGDVKDFMESHGFPTQEVFDGQKVSKEPIGSVTGRMTSKGPNFTQIPRKGVGIDLQFSPLFHTLTEVFGAPSEVMPGVFQFGLGPREGDDPAPLTVKEELAQMQAQFDEAEATRGEKPHREDPEAFPGEDPNWPGWTRLPQNSEFVVQGVPHLSRNLFVEGPASPVADAMTVPQWADTFRRGDTVKDRAKALVAGPRAKSYASPAANFSRWSYLCHEMFGIDISPIRLAEIMMACKMSRELHKHNPDNLLDYHGYDEIRDILLATPNMDRPAKVMP